MKKIVFIAIALFSFSFAEAQTKEETIAWLKDKLNKNIKKTKIQSYDKEHGIVFKIEDIEIFSFDECYIPIKYNSVATSTSGKLIVSTPMFSLIPTKDLKISEGGIRFESEVIKFYGFNKEIKDYEYMYKANILDLDIKDEEDDIFPRMEKAFKHLSSFCKKEEIKQTF